VPRTAIAAIEFLLQQPRDGFFVELPLVDGLGVFTEGSEQKEGVVGEKSIKKQHTPQHQQKTACNRVNVKRPTQAANAADITATRTAMKPRGTPSVSMFNSTNPHEAIHLQSMPARRRHRRRRTQPPTRQRTALAMLIAVCCMSGRMSASLIHTSSDESIVCTTLVPSRLPHRRRIHCASSEPLAAPPSTLPRCLPKRAQVGRGGRDRVGRDQGGGNGRKHHSNGTRAAASRAGGWPHNDGYKRQFGVRSPRVPPRPQPHVSVLRGPYCPRAPRADQRSG